MNSYNKKLEYMDWEFGVFFHFGIRAFYPGHDDWDGKEMDMAAFNPESLDCEQWIKTAKAGGAKYTVLTCKHHDGFALWPTKYSKYSVAGTPWKNGKGDVVREYVDACRKYGMKVGLYYSPAQWGKYAIDFKCGKPWPEHVQQVCAYMELMCRMYPNMKIKGYIWYIYSGRIKTVNLPSQMDLFLT